MIECHNLSLVYADEVALNPINLKIDKGEFVCILGASGSGKTSLLSLMSSIRKPSSGSIFIDGQELREPRIQTATILQDYGLLPWKRVYDNIVFSFKHHGIKIEESKIDEISKFLGIFDYYKRFPHQLSGGQKQRVAIARALCLDADLILMDEAFSALDSLTKETLQELLFKVHRETPVTTVFVSHNIEEAVFLGQRILIMEEGIIKHDFSNSVRGNRNTGDYYRMCQKVRGYLHD